MDQVRLRRAIMGCDAETEIEEELFKKMGLGALWLHALQVIMHRLRGPYMKKDSCNIGCASDC